MLLRKNSALLGMNKEELLLKVAERIAKVSPDMCVEDIDSMASRAVKALKNIQEVPRYS